MDRDRFAGEGGLLHPEVDRFHEAKIGRDVVPGFDENDIARSQLARGDGLPTAVAHHLRFRRRQFLQRGQRFLGATVLDDSEGGVHDDDGHDDRRIDPFAQQCRDPRRNHQQDHEKTFELLAQQAQERGAWSFIQLVRSINLQPPGRFSQHPGRFPPEWKIADKLLQWKGNAMESAIDGHCRERVFCGS